MKNECDKKRWVSYDQWKTDANDPLQRLRLHRKKALPNEEALHLAMKIILLEEMEQGIASNESGYACGSCGEKGHNRRTCPLKQNR